MTRFHHFAAIDWSGAVGERLPGIAVALCGEAGAPALVRPGHVWSRAEVLDWLLRDLPPDTLVGLDLGLSLPFADCRAFLPGWQASPADARGLWALVEQVCAADPHLGVASFIDHPAASRHFRRHGGREGDLFHLPGAAHRRGRLRVTEGEQAARLGCRPTSSFNLVGAAQVGKASLSGMRLLQRLPPTLPVWPLDPLPDAGSVVVEIYTAIPALAAGRLAGRAKMRSMEQLNTAVTALGSAPVPGSGPISDHAADALLAAAWLRVAAEQAHLWHPPALTPDLARTEGWTFGVP